MSLLNSGLANALGRPDMVYSAQRGVVGAPPGATIVGGSTAGHWR